MKKTNISPWVKRFSSMHLEKYKDKKKIRILDLACGSGRHSRYFVNKNLTVYSVDKDISKIRSLKTKRNISIIEADIEKVNPWDKSSMLKGKRFDLIIVTNYLFRPLTSSIIRALKNNGMLIYETFSKGNEKYGHPRNPNFLLKSGELLKMFGAALRIVAFEEGCIRNPRKMMVQRICATRSVKIKKFIYSLN